MSEEEETPVDPFDALVSTLSNTMEQTVVASMNSFFQKLERRLAPSDDTKASNEGEQSTGGSGASTSGLL